MENKVRFRSELIRIFIVVLIYIAGIIFKDDLNNTNYNWAELLVFITAYLISGWNVILKAIKNITRGKVFDENFLMTVATLGAIAIRQLPEAVAVMWFYNVGEFVEGLSVRQSRRSIKSLLEIRPDTAMVIRGANSFIVSPEEVSIGELIIVKPGEKIPLDGIITEGFSLIDAYPLTGESTPKKINTGGQVYAGTINKTNLIKVKINKLSGESSVSKILELVENSLAKKAETEKFITVFARYYTPVVVIIASAIAFLPPVLFAAETFSIWIYRALVILVISCPCALVISIPLGYFGGLGGASRKGILVKGSNFIDALAKVNTIVFDKTGTLTKGVFKVAGVYSYNGFVKEDILKFAAYAEHHSNHPIAESILAEYNKPVDEKLLSSFEDLSGKGIRATFKGKEIVAGNDRLLHEMNIDHPVCDIQGTVVHVVVDKIYAGYIIISDIVKESTTEAISQLRKENINDLRIFSGDNEASTKKIAAELSIDDFKAELLPEQKLYELEKIIFDTAKDEKVAFVGDGINDAPVITRADVGIAMGALGSDAAIESADVVIMADDLKKIPEAIKLSKRTKKIVWQNIIFALTVKAFFIAFGVLGIATMWEAVFADMGVAIIAIFNAMRVLRS